MKRTIISGAGIISKYGLGWGTFLNNISSKPVEKLFNEETLKEAVKDLAKVSPYSDYELSNWRGMDNLCKTAVMAGLMAAADAGISRLEVNPEKMGLFFGTVFGCLESNVNFHEKLLTSSPRFVSRTIFCNTVSNAAVGYLSLALNAKGMHLTCASGGVYPLIYAIQQMQGGRITQAVVGGMEKLHPIAVDGMSQLGFNKELTSENGFIPEEGAGALIVENLEDCIERQGKVLAEIVGYGVGPNFTITMKDALKKANLTPEQIGVLILQANGSKHDDDEMKSVQEVFKTNSSVLELIPLKQVIGETFGAGLIFSIVATLDKLNHCELVMVNSASFDSRSKGTFILKKLT